jgi:FixJ family two-component response regulator
MAPLSRELNGEIREVPLEVFAGILDLAEPTLERCSIHIIDSNSTDRASTFRIFSNLGYHCEIYSTLDELIKFQPSSGIALVHERPGGVSVAAVQEKAREAGLALTVVGSSYNPTIDTVVAAMQGGARHYFALPFVVDEVKPVLKKLAQINQAEQSSNEVRAQAALRLRRLSVRERQVVEHMVNGNSNKSTARLLDISPRTVEIHRMKAMGKLAAQNVSEAVRIWLIGTSDFRF